MSWLDLNRNMDFLHAPPHLGDLKQDSPTSGADVVPHENGMTALGISRSF